MTVSVNAALSDAAPATDAMRAELARYAFTCLYDGVDGGALNALRLEAAAQRASAWSRTSGAASPYQAMRAELGDAARAFLQSPELGGLLADLLDEPFTLSASASCYTYYEKPGDFLGLHRDRALDCAATVIVYVDARSSSPDASDSGLNVHIYAAADASQPPIATIPTRTGALVIGRGSSAWHERPPLKPGESVTALTACFKPAAFSVEPCEEERPETAELLLAEGQRAYRKGAYREAHERYSLACAHAWSDDRGWAGHGFVYWSRGLFDLALEAFTQASRRAEHDPSHWSNIGLCLRDLGELERAASVFAAAVSIAPDYAPAWNEWGNVLQDQGRPEEACDYYLRALALDPSRAVVHHNLGVAYARLDEPALAEAAFFDALARDAAYHHTLEELGALYAAKGSADDARSFLERAGTPRASMMMQELGLAAP